MVLPFSLAYYTRFNHSVICTLYSLCSFVKKGIYFCQRGLNGGCEMTFSARHNVRNGAEYRVKYTWNFIENIRFAS